MRCGGLCPGTRTRLLPWGDGPPSGSCVGGDGASTRALKQISTPWDPNVFWLHLTQVLRVALQAVTCPAGLAWGEQGVHTHPWCLQVLLWVC